MSESIIQSDLLKNIQIAAHWKDDNFNSLKQIFEIRKQVASEILKHSIDEYSSELELLNYYNELIKKHLGLYYDKV